MQFKRPVLIVRFLLPWRIFFIKLFVKNVVTLHSTMKSENHRNVLWRSSSPVSVPSWIVTGTRLGLSYDCCLAESLKWPKVSPQLWLSRHSLFYWSLTGILNCSLQIQFCACHRWTFSVHHRVLCYKWGIYFPSILNISKHSDLFWIPDLIF